MRDQERAKRLTKASLSKTSKKGNRQRKKPGSGVSPRRKGKGGGAGGMGTTWRNTPPGREKERTSETLDHPKSKGGLQAAVVVERDDRASRSAMDLSRRRHTWGRKNFLLSSKGRSGFW